MTPTEQLKNEHQAIKLMLEIISRKVDKEDVPDILEFFAVFVDKCHHGKEEDLLFPAMVEAGVPRDGGPISVMLDEHNLGRSYVKEVRGANTQEEFAAAAKEEVILLTEHIEKEDNILYPIADMHLSKEKQEELLEQFKKVEEEKIGPGKHEEFHELLDRLCQKYLK